MRCGCDSGVINDLYHVALKCGLWVLSGQLEFPVIVTYQARTQDGIGPLWGGSVRNQDTGQPLVYTRSLISDQPVSLYFLESRGADYPF